MGGEWEGRAWEFSGRRAWEEVKRVRTMKTPSWAIGVSLVTFKQNNAFSRSLNFKGKFGSRRDRRGEQRLKI